MQGFILPLRFQVKSILADFWKLKTAVITLEDTLNFDFCENFTLENVKTSKSKIVNIAILVLKNDQNWFHVKSEWQKNPEISTLWGVLWLLIPRLHKEIGHESIFSSNKQIGISETH